MTIRNQVLYTALIFVAAQATLIHASEPGAVIRLHGVYLNGSAEVPSMRPGSPSFSIDDGIGIDLGFAYRFSKRLGIGVSGALSDLDVDPFFPYPVTGTAGKDLRVQQLALEMEIHLTPDSRFDLYLAPSFIFLHFDDLKGWPAGASWRARRQLDDHSTWGLGLGFELPFGEAGWAFSSRLRYVAAELHDPAEYRDGRIDVRGVDTDLGLSSIAVGVAYRF